MAHSLGLCSWTTVLHGHMTWTWPSTLCAPFPTIHEHLHGVLAFAFLPRRGSETNKLEVAHTTSATKSVRYCALANAIPPSFFPLALFYALLGQVLVASIAGSCSILGDRLTRTEQKQVGGEVEG